MRTLSKVSAICGLLALFAISALAQTYTLGTTTLSAAVAKTDTQVCVASATGISVPTVSAPGTMLFTVDGEPMQVAGAGASSTCFVMDRHANTRAHVSGTLVFVGPPNQFFDGPDPQGGCTRSTLYVLPRINTATGVISDCLGGQWVAGLGTALPASHIQSPVVGGIAATSLTAGVAQTDTTMGCIEVDLPYNKLLTGIGLLNGATVATDNNLVVLYDAAGNLLANSAAAGVVSAGASDYQYIAFTKKYFAVGPALYYACMQNNGSTALVHMADAATGADTLWAGAISTITFGTIPATITPPTTFTTAVGPMVALY